MAGKVVEFVSRVELTHIHRYHSRHLESSSAASLPIHSKDSDLIVVFVVIAIHNRGNLETVLRSSSLMTENFLSSACHFPFCGHYGILVRVSIKSRDGLKIELFVVSKESPIMHSITAVVEKKVESI